MDKKHTDREYERELKRLRERLFSMAERVEEMISHSIEALVRSDPELAKDTIKMDHRVNQDEMEIDELCLVILARRQPMASDLRFLTLALKMVTDLERIGDLAVNICERTMDLISIPRVKPYEDIPRMAGITQSMLRDAVKAFMKGDTGLAREVIDRDDEVDNLYTEIFRELLWIMTRDNSKIEPGIHVQSVAKYLERIADHATNLAEQVIFMIRSKDIRHMGKLEDR